MWKVIAASVVGASHKASGGDCQDASGIRLVEINREQILVFAISDGAGSAKFAAEGSKLVVQNFCDGALAALHSKIADEPLNLISLCEHTRSAVIKLANEAGNPVREYSATLIGGVITPQQGFFVQIGDGAIVIRQNELLTPVTWPDAGEYVNTTTFITSDDWSAHLQEKIVKGDITDVAAFSDGIQDLALQHSDRAVHSGFFDPMITHLRQSFEPSNLNQALASFLDSKAINERTDDDKTLMIACRVD